MTVDRAPQEHEQVRGADRLHQVEPLIVTRIRDPKQLPALAEAWDQLDDEGRPGGVFRSSAWLVPWWKHFSAGKRLCVYVARRGTRLVGVLPGYHTRTLAGGWQFRLLGDGVVTSDYLGVIARAEDLETASLAIGRALLAHEDDVMLEGVETTDPLVDAMEREARGRGLACATVELDPSRFIALDTAASYEAWLREHPRANPGRRRKRRPLERREGFRIEVLTDEQDVVDGL